ncbi:hypothetical protein [Flavonifractor sp. An100]|uniref:hypothetical protein n=1 Tax=Flavonifractor sp. An100 TaxID=1965538 RepID=UPI000B3A6824|nr:hypothetical protein [Flavonifractor sp. An100]OUQ76157.1 hypothetical protein B5E43_12515 [Flavonifractor sp. An100]
MPEQIQIIISDCSRENKRKGPEEGGGKGRKNLGKGVADPLRPRKKAAIIKKPAVFRTALPSGADIPVLDATDTLQTEQVCGI